MQGCVLGIICLEDILEAVIGTGASSCRNPCTLPSKTMDSKKSVRESKRHAECAACGGPDIRDETDNGEQSAVSHDQLAAIASARQSHEGSH